MTWVFSKSQPIFLVVWKLFWDCITKFSRPLDQKSSTTFRIIIQPFNRLESFSYFNVFIQQSSTVKHLWVLQSDQVWSRLNSKQKFLISIQNFGRAPSWISMTLLRNEKYHFTFRVPYLRMHVLAFLLLGLRKLALGHESLCH